MKSLCCCCLSCASLLLFAAPGLALPKTGTAAPKLKFAELLQAPPGTRADLASLKGKTVVLEFWATWCAPCVQSIPHLNDLAAAVDPKKVAFISVDDEDVMTVGLFISRRKMAGWVALDPGHETFKTYGITQRPATIVIDGAGRVAAVTTPERLTPAGLMALADAKPLPRAAKSPLREAPPTAPAVVTPEVPPAAAAPASLRSEADRLPSLFEISISPAPKSKSNTFQMNHDRTGNFWWYGVDESFSCSGPLTFLCGGSPLPM